MWQKVLKVVWWLIIAGVVTATSAMFATIFATRQIRNAIQRSAPELQSQVDADMADSVSLDFYKATGIPETELHQWFEEFRQEKDLDRVRVVLTLQDKDGHYLVDSPVGLQWKDGSEWVHIGSSGLAEFALSPAQLTDLKLVVPGHYQNLKQRTFSMGSHYEPPPDLSVSTEGMPVVSDDQIQQELVRYLRSVRSAHSLWQKLDAEAGLGRSMYQTDLPNVGTTQLTPEQLYELRMKSVVIIGFLKPDGQVSQGTGFVLNDSGVIATNFHVANKPDAVACGILTADHEFYEVKRILAGNPPDDLALLKVDCDQLNPIPLAAQDAFVASELFAISHPHSNYFSLTHGRVTRYFRRVRHAFPSVRLGVTTEFAQGSSGGPVMDHFGNVTGILSATQQAEGQMVHREAIPVSALRRMVGAMQYTSESDVGTSLTTADKHKTQ